MRRFLAALALLAACTPTDPIPPDDAGPCNGTCGAGTACVAGQCVTVDGGVLVPDVVGVDAGRDAESDTGQVVDATPSDSGQDANSPTDTGCPSGQVICNPSLPTCIDLRRGRMLEDGRYGSCGQCGFTCGTGFVCEDGRCAR